MSFSQAPAVLLLGVSRLPKPSRHPQRTCTCHCPPLEETPADIILPFAFDCGLKRNIGLMVMSPFQYWLRRIQPLLAEAVPATTFPLALWFYECLTRQDVVKPHQEPQISSFMSPEGLAGWVSGQQRKDRFIAEGWELSFLWSRVGGCLNPIGQNLFRLERKAAIHSNSSYSMKGGIASIRGVGNLPIPIQLLQVTHWAFRWNEVFLTFSFYFFFL